MRADYLSLLPSNVQVKDGRRFLLVSEVSAANVHVEPNGLKPERFEVVACKYNSSKSYTKNKNGKKHKTGTKVFNFALTATNKWKVALVVLVGMLVSSRTC